MELKVVWLIRADMPEVLNIESLCFDHAWSEEDFHAVLRQRNAIGMVAKAESRVRGFMIYELHKSKLRIMNFAVHPGCQRRGVGRAMVRRLIDKLSQQRRKEITLEVRETNLDAQLFFSEMGFRCLSVVRNHYEDTDEDAYLFRYVMPIHVQAGRVS